MKKIGIVLCAILLLFSGCAKDKNLEKDKIVAINATTFFQQRKDSDFYILLDSNAKNSITEEELSLEFDDIIKIYGEPLEMDSESIVAVSGTYENTVSVPVRFKTGWMDMTYTINSTSSVTSFKLTASDKLDENGYNETQYVYTTETGEGKYVFTKTNSSEQSPLIIFVHDKDALDKNSTIGVNKVFRNLAYALADQGVASIRYDRTILDNEDAEDSIALIAEELQAIIAEAKELEGIDTNKIYVLGYGLGGYVLPSFADQLDVAGFILSSSPSANVYLTIYQEELYKLSCNTTMTDMNKEIRKQEIENSKTLIESLDSTSDFYQDIFGHSSAFWLELQAYDAIETVKLMEKPVLITQGSNDYQVKSSSYNGWVDGLKGCSHVSFKYYKNMDHLLSIRKTTSVPADQLTESEISTAYVQDLIKFVQ